MDLSDIRRDYTKGGLRREDLTQNPLDLFNIWLQQAIDAQLSDPTAMTVATVDSEGRPYQRIVLLKDVGDDGFVFYTNLGSRKVLHFQDNANISL
ncbi:pyridoxamine 5'-phosphate oxidase family protein, partial [Photobacterium damselae subsp. damselae]|nr:pyridoxamine 5'-phosphate oxidase family protein [Photobacterium damselae subsp. damselae]